VTFCHTTTASFPESLIISMEGDKQWRLLNKTSVPVFGASSADLNDSLYVIGGRSVGNKDPQTVLQVRNFDMNELTWKPVVVNASDVLNRAYHASATLKGSVYTFGGAAAALLGGQETLLDEVVKSTPDDLEGLKCVVSHSANAQLKGHSACTLGSGVLVQRIVLFGGSNPEGTCDSNALVVYVADHEEEIVDGELLKPVTIEGPAPPPRSHHAAAVTGYRHEYLVVAGGWNGAEAYDDVWVCDATNLLSGRPLEPEEVIPVKGKKKDEAPIPEIYTWHQIQLSEPMDGRFMHGCWANSNTLDEGLKIKIFGGMTAFGPVSQESMLEYAVEFEEGEYHAALECVHEPEPQDEDDVGRYGFTTHTVYEDGTPALILVFGGQSVNCDSQCSVLDANTQIAAHLSSCVPLPRDEEEEEADSNIKVINYPNGDVYEGEIFVDIEEEERPEAEAKGVDETAQIKHGEGVMTYADGAVYEGHWEYNNQDGHGKYITFDQETMYDGNFSANEFNGEGQLSLKNGQLIYNGNFEQGKFQGQGTLLDKGNNTIYEGEFSQGMKNGAGVLREVNDHPEAEECGPLIYSGGWINDKPAGQGTLVLPGGHVYTGDIVNSIPEGKGVCNYADGGEYTGSWRSGKRNGVGVHISRSLDEYKGKWVGDVRSGRGTWVSKRGDSYEGMWDGNFPHGQGVMTYKVKDAEENCSRELSYSGEWNHGKRHGFGEVVYMDGTVKKGSWKTNQYDEALADYDAGQ